MFKNEARGRLMFGLRGVSISYSRVSYSRGWGCSKAPQNHPSCAFDGHSGALMKSWGMLGGELMRSYGKLGYVRGDELMQ